MTARPRGPSWLTRLDEGVYFFERGVVVVAMLTLAVAYFFDIVHVEVASSDNAFDRIIYRLAGVGDDARPEEAFRQRVQTQITPAVLALFGWVLAYLAVLSQPKSRQWGFGRRFALSVAVLAGAIAVLAAIAYSPPVWVCALTWLAFFVAYGWRAHKKNKLIAYALAWIPGIAAFGWLFTHIEEGYSWAQDLGKVLIMWMGFLGASMATRDRKHIRIDFVRKALSPERRPAYNALSYLVTLLFCGLLGVLAIAYLYHDIELGGRLTSIPIPLAWIVAPIAFALVVMVFRFAGRMVLAAQGRERELGGEGELPPATEGGQA